MHRAIAIAIENRLCHRQRTAECGSTSAKVCSDFRADVINFGGHIRDDDVQMMADYRWSLLVCVK